MGNRCACGNEQNTHFWAYCGSHHLIGGDDESDIGVERDGTK